MSNAATPRGGIDAVHIETIPHKSQRYSTSGDWWVDGSTLQLRVSDLGDWRYAMCVAIHELTEALLCHHRGISTEAVDAFDTGIGADLDEPGDDPRAPYHREHTAAYVPEMLLLSEFGLSAKDYTERLDALE